MYYHKLNSTRFLKLILVVCHFVVVNVFAQDDSTQVEDVDGQSWMDFRTFYTINDKWTYDGDYGLRGFLSKENWRRLYIHPAFVYDANTFIDLRGGVRFILTREKDATNTFELRPWQGVRFLWPKTKWIVLSQYIRFEERFTFGLDDGSFDFVVRARYRIMAKTPNLRLVSLNQTFYFLTSFEIFGNIGKAIEESFVDRTRLTFGMGYFITQSWRAELHYILQGSNSWTQEGAKLNVRILRLRIRYYINFQY